MRQRLPVPEVAVKKKALQRSCFCGECPRCYGNDAKQREYRRRKAGIAAEPYRRPASPPKQIDMNRVEAYWNRVKV
jgi:hypothetical protein